MHKFKPLHPVMLGRPVQAFEQLAQRLAQQVIQQLQLDGHRSIALHIHGAHFAPADGTSDLVNNPCVTLQRATVLAYMQARYGFASEGMDQLGDNTPAVNATETRIGHALQAAIAQAVHDCLPATPATASTSMGWQWRAHIQIGPHAPQPLTIDLHAQANHSLEAHLAAHRQTLQRRNTGHSKAAAPLPVQLIAQLVEQKITAADIQGLRPGAVLPITLGRATVLLNDEPMLSASVAEHQGKLHLTAFETLE